MGKWGNEMGHLCTLSLDVVLLAVEQTHILRQIVVLGLEGLQQFWDSPSLRRPHLAVVVDP